MGYRLKPNVSRSYYTCGDLVEDGSAPHLMGRVPWRRLQLRTDENGFAGRFGPAEGPVEIVAVGDSFTFGEALPRRLGWPTLLADLSGWEHIANDTRLDAFQEIRP